MTRFKSRLLLCTWWLLTCCIAKAETAQRISVVPNPPTANAASSADSGVEPAAHQDILVPPPAPPRQPAFEGEILPPFVPTPDSELTLAELEQLALSGNPAIAQAEARVRALRGRWVQVGLPPNPSIGYMGSEIGNEHQAGQQGGYVGQDFITGGKLRLNRAIVSQEIERAEQQAAAMRLRVQTDVRRWYYSALVAQRRVNLAEELVRVSGNAVKASQELMRAEEIPQAGLLQTEVEQQNAMILSQTALSELEGAWRQLSSVVASELAMRPLLGDVSSLPDLLDWNDELIRVTTTSPEVAAAAASVSRAQVALQRARREPIPDVFTQVGVQYDNATEDTITSVQVGMPIPLWNRNQGGIRQAEAEVTLARRNAERVELDLKRRLAFAFQQYSSARSQADTYKTKILPKAQETFQLVQRGYSLGELGYLDLLTAQRTYSQTNLAYLDALSNLWRSWSEIEGLLLSESLALGVDFLPN